MIDSTAAINPPHAEEPGEASQRRASRSRGGQVDERKSGKPDMQSFETAAARPPQDEAGRERGQNALFRFAADMLSLWGLCANASCRRARACRGDAHDCVQRYAQLAPEDAREGLKAMVEGKREGLCFDSAQDRAYDEVEALMAWREQVERANAARVRGTALAANR